MAKSRTKFFTANVVKDDGALKYVGLAMRMEGDTYYINLEKKVKPGECVRLSPRKSRA